MAKWNLLRSEPRNDGSGSVSFEIEGLDDLGNSIPGMHTEILIDGAAIISIKNNSSLTKAQKANAIKALIANKLPSEWLVDSLNAKVSANLLSLDGKSATDELVVLFKATGYPIQFTL